MCATSSSALISLQGRSAAAAAALLTQLVPPPAAAVGMAAGAAAVGGGSSASDAVGHPMSWRRVTPAQMASSALSQRRVSRDRGLCHRLGVLSEHAWHVIVVSLHHQQRRRLVRQGPLEAAAAAAAVVVVTTMVPNLVTPPVRHLVTQQPPSDRSSFRQLPPGPQLSSPPVMLKQALSRLGCLISR